MRIRPVSKFDAKSAKFPLYKPINMENVYNVTTAHFLAKHGDGYGLRKDDTKIEFSGLTKHEVLQRCVERSPRFIRK